MEDPTGASLTRSTSGGQKNVPHSNQQNEKSGPSPVANGAGRNYGRQQRTPHARKTSEERKRETEVEERERKVAQMKEKIEKWRSRGAEMETWGRQEAEMEAETEERRRKDAEVGKDGTGIHDTMRSAGTYEL